MKSSNKGIRGFTIFAFTVSTTMSMGLGFLPFVSGEEVRSSWLKLPIAALPYFLLFILLSAFMKKYNSHDFFGILKSSVWRWVYWFISIYLVISLYYAGGVLVNGMGLIVETYLLPNTPMWLYIGTFMVVSAIGVYYGIETIGRFVVLTFVFEFLILTVIIFLGFSDFFRWIYIPPIVSVDLTVMLKGAVSDMARYGGILPLFGLVAYVKQRQGLLTSMSFGLTFVVITYVSLSIVTIGTFGFEETINLVSPFIALIQSFKSESAMFERLDLFFLSFWLYGFYKIYTIHVWFLTYIYHKTIPKLNRHLGNIGTHIIVFFLVMMLPTYVDRSVKIHNFNTIVFSLVVPISLLIFLLLKKKSGDKSYEA
ncbi:GerAB/ArcD/ProY family transporter [Bacillus sp. FJAT-45350]|uniref:GerAB/ArcD/ProY family transporter n=1 Tax=Bacillus sp. FJAT-45350 TaxID=2011014 RepID=UPI000BB861BF|nr:GerAB/ArcD/ProY family transporter [Bacillus sp. FJAT-45350]